MIGIGHWRGVVNTKAAQNELLMILQIPEC